MKRYRIWGGLAVAILAAFVLLAALPLSASAEDQSSPLTGAPVSSWGGCAYAARYGDTLWSVAMRYGVSPQYMATMNGLSGYSQLYPGMRMYVPCKAGNQPAYQPPAYGGSYQNICAYYLVRPGDDLYRIGLRYGMSWQTLALANHLYNPNRIYYGMRLAIPCSKGYPSGYPQPNPYPQPKPYPQPNPNPYPRPTTMPGGGGSSTVVMQNIMFNPGTITIHAGQAVTWRNGEAPASGIPHTTTSDTGVWGSQVLNPGGTFTFKFNTPGTYNYHCMIHPNMHGTVMVTP